MIIISDSHGDYSDYRDSDSDNGNDNDNDNVNDNDNKTITYICLLLNIPR